MLPTVCVFIGLLLLFRQMKMRPGEKLIDRLDCIEDTKGNNGEKGNSKFEKIGWFIMHIDLTAHHDCLHNNTFSGLN